MAKSKNKIVEQGLTSPALRARRIGCYIFLVFITIICLFSFWMLLINATRPHSKILQGFAFFPGKSLIHNIKTLANDMEIPVFRGLLNSFIIGAFSAVLSVYFSALTAFGIHAYKFKGRNTIFMIILLIMTVPQQVSALGFVDMMRKLNLYNTYVPLIVPAVAAPVVFFFMKQYMESALPVEIVEASRIDGAGEFRTFNEIVLPIMKPAMAVQAIFTFVTSWNNYFIPTLIIEDRNKKTLPILIYALRAKELARLDWGEVYVAIAFSIFPVVIVYLFLSKYIIQGVALGSVKG